MPIKHHYNLWVISTNLSLISFTKLRNEKKRYYTHIYTIYVCIVYNIQYYWYFIGYHSVIQCHNIILKLQNIMLYMCFFACILSLISAICHSFLDAPLRYPCILYNKTIRSPVEPKYTQIDENGQVSLCDTVSIKL